MLKILYHFTLMEVFMKTFKQAFAGMALVGVFGLGLIMLK